MYHVQYVLDVKFEFNDQSSPPVNGNRCSHCLDNNVFLFKNFNRIMTELFEVWVGPK